MSKEDVFVGAIDQGTSSSRFIIYDAKTGVVGCHHVEFTQFYPQAGWVEHDPMEILESVKVCVAKAVDKATADGFNVDKGLKAIGLTNQRETTLLWSKSTGLPLHNAIVWMDARTSSICRSTIHFLNFASMFFTFVRNLYPRIQTPTSPFSFTLSLPSDLPYISNV